MNTELDFVLQQHQKNFHPLIEMKEGDDIIPFDFTAVNEDITIDLISDTELFSEWVDKKLSSAKARFGIGGYNENRTLYKRSKLFSGREERSVHIGLDIWGAAGTEVFAPLGGMVHSFAFNDNFGDYGATIILQHQLDTVSFYTLFGHLALADLSDLRKGKFVTRGELIGHFGKPQENGNWPPHLHLQVIADIAYYEGDYPGVCTLSEAPKYLANTADPALLLNLSAPKI